MYLANNKKCFSCISSKTELLRSFIVWTIPHCCALYVQHIPLTISLQGLLGVLLGEGEAERLRCLLTLSQMHPPSLSLQVVIPTSTSISPTKFCARSFGQTESRAVGLERDGYSSSWGRTRQCREDRQVLGPKPPPPPTSQLSSSEGADRKVVQNIILADGWAWAMK